MEFQPLMFTIIKSLIAILLAIFLGNGAVYFFNKMPAKWFCEYGEEPKGILADPFTQRIKSHPWKIIFTMFFIIIGIWFVMDDYRFGIAAIFTIWLLIEMSIGDVLYRIIPDQLIILMAVSSIGYFPYFDSWKHSLFGFIAGVGLMGMVAVIGRLIYSKDTVGGGDIKLFASLGLIAGPLGIICIFVLSTAFSTVHFICKKMINKPVRHRRQITEIGNKDISRQNDDTQAMVPYITVAAIIYLCFLWGMAETFFEL